MNPDLLRLIEALDALTECSPTNTEEARRLASAYRTLLDDLLARHSGLSRETAESIIKLAHTRWLKAQQRPTTVPPKA